MKNYKVTLSRSYFVSINAENKESAMGLAEFYIGTGKDDSNPTDRMQYDFLIEDVELANNEATEVIEVDDKAI